MELSRKMVQITIFICAFVLVTAWQCQTLNCIIYPLSLKLWKDHIEVSARTVRVRTGSSFSITCDGSCVGNQENPHLRWYGPDKHWIAYEGAANRVHVEYSFSGQFLKLHIAEATVSDQGVYACRGWLGEQRGWDIKTIRLIVDQSAEPGRSEHENTMRPERTMRPFSIVPSTTSTSTSSTTSLSSSTTTTTTASESPTTADEGCLFPRFSCGSGECLQRQQVCDSLPDCRDNSDESSCNTVNTVCTEDMIACTDGNGCVTTSQICDGSPQCSDRSDEDPAVCLSTR